MANVKHSHALIHTQRNKKRDENIQLSPLALFRQYDNERWKEQQKINMLNYYWNCTNLIHAAQVSQRCKQLDQEIACGKRVVLHLSKKVQHNTAQMTTIHRTIDELDAQVLDHKQQVLQMRNTFLQQQDRIKVSIENLKLQVQRQKQMLQEQEYELKVMQHGKYTKDLTIDMMILCVCSAVTRNALLQSIIRVFLSPIQTIALKIMPRHRFLGRRQWKQAVEAATFIASVYVLRTWAYYYGLHHSVGSYPKYVKQMFRCAFQGLTSSLSFSNDKQNNS